MTTTIDDTSDHLLFTTDSREKASELFRLALPFLSKHKLITNPVNFSLAYHYMAGRCPAMREKLDELLADPENWSQEEANQLFQRYLYGCDSETLDELRSDLLTIVAETIGALVDLAGKTSLSSKKLESHIDRLAKSRRTEDVLSVVAAILADTRSLAAETRELEKELSASSSQLGKLKDELKRTRYEAFHDALTGILNRRGFDENLSMLIKDAEQRHMADFSLILIDLDNFKVINDTQGHLVGDKVLCSVGSLLKKHTKGRDASARFGGDEFALLLPDTRITSAFNLAENLRLSIEKLVLRRSSTGERLAAITSSFGVASYRLGEAADEFVERCDKALYRAKSIGRNRVVLAD